MNFVLNFFLASVGPWLAKKLLQPQVLAQLGYDLVEYWVKRSDANAQDPKFLADVKAYLELK
ncbi:MAG: hypothetical protein V4490_06525 [Pseudomonadota bacterium]